MLSFTIGRSSIALFVNGAFYSIDESHINYLPLREELKKPVVDRDLELIASLVTVKKAICHLTAGLVEIMDDEIRYDGEAVNNYMTKRMMDLLRDGFDVTPWAKFMDNVMLNPAVYARNELYEWMEKAEMPITPDGHFLAFKKVRVDYTDCHTGKFDHSPGTTVEMERSACDPDRTNHCSTGFHFCSAGYLQSFTGQRIVIVKINPRDVTSIPNDYQFTKGRTCRYEVVAEMSKENMAYEKCWKTGLVDLENPAEFPPEVLVNITLPAPALNEPAHVTEAYESGQATEKVSDYLERVLDNSETKEIYGIPTHQLTDAEIDSMVKGRPDAAKMRVALKAERAAAQIEKGMTDATPQARAFPTPTQLEEAAKQKIERASKPKTKNTTPKEFKTSTGRKITATAVTRALEGASIRAAARALGIGESTLRGWKKKLENKA